MLLKQDLGSDGEHLILNQKKHNTPRLFLFHQWMARYLRHSMILGAFHVLPLWHEGDHHSSGFVGDLRVWCWVLEHTWKHLTIFNEECWSI